MSEALLCWVLFSIWACAQRRSLREEREQPHKDDTAPTHTSAEKRCWLLQLREHSLTLLIAMFCRSLFYKVWACVVDCFCFGRKPIHKVFVPFIVFQRFVLLLAIGNSWNHLKQLQDTQVIDLLINCYIINNDQPFPVRLQIIKHPSGYTKKKPCYTKPGTYHFSVIFKNQSWLN